MGPLLLDRSIAARYPYPHDFPKSLFFDVIPGVGTLILASAASFDGPPLSFLDLSWNLLTTTGEGEVTIRASADGFEFPPDGVDSRLTSTVTSTRVGSSGSGSVLAQQWVDLGGLLFATTGPTPGPQSGSNSFTDIKSIAFSSLAPYSITEEAIVSIAQNSHLTGTMDSTVVPEPVTMFLGGTGLLMLGYAGRKRLFGR
jgi:hypothetical protein